MGSFMGHLLDGAAFICYALWMLVNIFVGMYRSRMYKNAAPWHNQFYYTGPIANRSFPLDSVGKIVFGLAAACVETYMGMSDGHFVHFNNTHHLTIAVFFVLSGVADLVKQSRCPTPESVDGAMLALAFVVQSFMFLNHQHDAAPFEMMVHRFIIYVTAATAACICYECQVSAGPMAALVRAFLVMLLGTWLVHIGFMLYPPLVWMKSWNDGSHLSLALAPTLFAWHGIVNVVVMAIVGIVVHQILRISDRSAQVTYSSLLQEG